MDTKLTLKLDKKIIEKAKEYASKNGQSLSRMIEQYLRIVTSNGDNSKVEEEISEYIKSIPQSFNIPEDFDLKKEHEEHLLKKHSK